MRGIAVVTRWIAVVVLLLLCACSGRETPAATVSDGFYQSLFEVEGDPTEDELFGVYQLVQSTIDGEPDGLLDEDRSRRRLAIDDGSYHFALTCFDGQVIGVSAAADIEQGATSGSIEILEARSAESPTSEDFPCRISLGPDGQDRPLRYTLDGLDLVLVNPADGQTSATWRKISEAVLRSGFRRGRPVVSADRRCRSRAVGPMSTVRWAVAGRRCQLTVVRSI